MFICTNIGPLRRNRRRTATGLFAIFLIFNVIVVAAVAWLIAVAILPPSNARFSNWWPAIEALRLNVGDDSWRHMTVARDYVESENSSAFPIYTAFLVNQRQKFQYPLFSLLLYTPLEDIGATLGMGRDQFFGLINWIMVVIALLVTYLLSVRLLPREEVRSKAALAGLVLLAGLTFHPLIKGVWGGQIQVWINSLFAVALLAWVLGYKAASGAFIGAMCLLKPHYALFLLWAGARKEWRFAAGCAVVGLTGLGVSILLWGWAHNLDYINGLRFLSERGEAYYLNQSPNGLLNRLVWIFDQSRLHRPMRAGLPYPPYTPFVYYGTVLCAIALIGAALYVRARDRNLDFCIFAVSATVASPIAWTHHYGVLFPIYAVAFVAILDDRKALAWLGVSYVLTSNWFAAFIATANTPFNFLQSYMLFGALILLALLYRSGAAAPERGGQARSDRGVVASHAAALQ